jgi:hypothetical protein
MTPEVVNIVSAEHVGGYRLRLRFDDGTERTVDFQPFLAGARHPDIRAFLDPTRFNTFQIKHGDLVWGNFELCFPIMDLYRGQLLHGAAESSAA